MPLGTALAADDPDADYEEVVETLPGDELDEAVADGEGDSDIEDGPDSTGLDVIDSALSAEAFGGEMGLLDETPRDIQDKVNINDTTGEPAPEDLGDWQSKGGYPSDGLKSGITITGTGSPTTNEITGDITYEDVPAGAKLTLSLGYHLEMVDDFEYKNGDHFSIQLPKGLNFDNVSGALMVGSTNVGSWAIDSSGLLTATFNNGIEGAADYIWGRIAISGEFNYLEDDDSNPTTTSIVFGTQTITINRRSQELDPKPPAFSTLVKSNSYNPETNEITWTITITPPKDENNQPIPNYSYKGFTLTDTLSAGHSYVNASFSATGHTVTNTSPWGTGTSFSYNFPDDATGEQIITYKTTPEFKAGDNSFNNSVNLKKGVYQGIEEAVKSTFSVAGFFGKTSEEVITDGNDKYVKWTVTLKIPATPGNAYTYPNATITDTIPAVGGTHTFVNTALYPVTIKYPGETEVRKVGTDSKSGTVTIDSATNKILTYHFPSDDLPTTGEAPREYILTYYTKYEHDFNAGVNDEVSLHNGAKFDWDGGSGGVGPWDIPEVEIEKTIVASGGLISKEALNSGNFEHSSDHTKRNGDYLLWKVTINGNKLPMSDNTYFTDTVKTSDGHVLVVDATRPLTVTKDGENPITYTGTETGDHGTLTLDPTAPENAADSHFMFQFPATDKNARPTYIITFYTQITEDGLGDMYKNGKKEFWNNAKLFGLAGNGSVDAHVEYNLQMLDKDIKIANYDYTNRIATWKLVVNRNKLQMNSATLTDYLPDGMILSPADEAAFSVSIDGAASVSLSTLDIIGFETLANGVDGHKNGFKLTFPAGTEKYEITYTTHIEDSALLTSGDKEFVNHSSLFVNEEHTISDNTSKLTIKNEVITKTTGYTSASKEDVIEWSVEINPANVELNSAFVTDELQDGLKLDINSVYLYNATVTSATDPKLVKDGDGRRLTLSDGLELETDSSGKETFTVKLPDGEGRYILEFKTNITKDKIPIENKITLSGSTNSPEGGSTKKGISVGDIFSEGGAGSNNLKIKKIDAVTKEPLDGVTFKLVRPDGKTLYKEGMATETAEGGIAEFKAIHNWGFYIEETNTLDGYLAPTKLYGPFRPTDVDATGVFVIENTLALYPVEITKVGANSVLLSGGEFALTGTGYDGTQISLPADGKAPITAVNGTVSFGQLPIGTYEITEVKPPTGHVLSKKVIVVRVDYVDSTKTAVKATYIEKVPPVGTSPADSYTLPNEPEFAGDDEVSFIKIDAETKAPISGDSITGGSFTLKGKSYNNSAYEQTVSADANGVVKFTDVPINATGEVYTIVEGSAPHGYLNLDGDKTILKVSVVYKPGTDSAERLVTITKPDGTPLGEDDKAGNDIIFKNTPAVADVEFTKLSSLEPEPTASPAPGTYPAIKITGGQFKISGVPEATSAVNAADGISYEATASATDNKVLFENVPVNAEKEFYTITEVAPPPGYLPTNEKLYVRVEYTDDKTDTNVVFVDENGEIPDNSIDRVLKNDPAPYIPDSVKITVFKTDEDGAKLPGASFTLYDKDGKALATAVSNAEGIAEFTNVPGNANYTIRETAAPEGYALSEEVISVSTYAGSTLSFTMVNKKQAPETGSIIITKTDENGALLPGASFTLYDESGKALATVTSDAAGTLSFADIPVGSYTIRETAAPAGFVLSADVLSVDLKKDETRSFTFVNRREDPGTDTGSLGLLKVNNDGDRLAGAEFSLYDANGELVARAVTGADGIVRFTNLAYGSYSVRETAAPAGYKLFDGAQAVVISAATPNREFTLRNAREDEPDVGGWEDEDPGPGDPTDPDGKLPQTGGLPQSLFLLLAGLALLGLGIFTLKGRKKQHGTEN